jgi:hypothetical protein
MLVRPDGVGAKTSSPPIIARTFMAITSELPQKQAAHTYEHICCNSRQLDFRRSLQSGRTNRFSTRGRLGIYAHGWLGTNLRNMVANSRMSQLLFSTCGQSCSRPSPLSIATAPSRAAFLHHVDGEVAFRMGFSGNI